VRRREALLERAKSWLDALGIVPEFDLPSVEPPAASREARPLRVTLLDLLLLGAPDGNTELIEGQVFRSIDMRTASAARGLFKQIARELCGYFGVEWRNRHVEGKSSFDLERAHLAVDGSHVDLRIDMPRAVWDTFVQGHKP